MNVGESIHGLYAVVVAFILLLISFVVTPATTDYTGGASTTLQKKVAKDYPKLRLRHRSFNDFCYPKKFQLQPPQKFIARWLSPRTKNMNMLGFHRIGAGKTCAAITAAEQWTDYGKPLVVMPASLIPGFRNELRSECPDASGFSYITPGERAELKLLSVHSDRYKEIIRESNRVIDARYTIMSYNKFSTDPPSVTPPIMIIDEIHNANNPAGTYFAMILKYITARPTMRLLALSATPIFDHPEELLSLLRLLRQNPPADILDKPTLLANTLSGLVSYYAGAPPETFPSTTLHYEVCKMSPFQSKWYTAEVKAEITRTGVVGLSAVSNNFYAKSRARANMVFPLGLSGTDGLPKLSKDKLLTSLPTYSCKFAKLMKRLKGGQLSFVFTSFTSFGGIKSLRKCMTAYGFVDYAKAGAGPKRFAIWSGEQTPREKDAIRGIFNSTANDSGELIQIVIGSPAIKEGVTLLRVRQVHVIEPSWNHSMHKQIFGRAIRFCSHKTLPRADRHVDIHLYIAVTARSGITRRNLHAIDITPAESVDAYVLELADQKQERVQQLIDVIIESAVDKELNQ